MSNDFQEGRAELVAIDAANRRVMLGMCLSALAILTVWSIWEFLS
jgi:hypothetical protein